MLHVLIPKVCLPVTAVVVVLQQHTQHVERRTQNAERHARAVKGMTANYTHTNIFVFKVEKVVEFGDFFLFLSFFFSFFFSWLDLRPFWSTKYVYIPYVCITITKL
eukprot:Phypoly_transcript_19572.p1 GENE.Phypoly_transcript_19572~~Phypoly_transcript_19572.p1  ORF type:complete len:106 (+),score=6.73 Phypoly_transcript_19572:115-432(+)